MSSGSFLDQVWVVPAACSSRRGGLRQAAGRLCHQTSLLSSTRCRSCLLMYTNAPAKLIHFLPVQTGRHRSILEPFGCSSFSLQCTTLMCTSSTRTAPPCHPSFAISPSSQHQSSYAARCCRLNMAYAADHGQLHDSHTGVLLLAAEQWALCQKKQPSPMLISSFPVEYSRMTNLQGSQTTISVSSEKSSAAQ